MSQQFLHANRKISNDMSGAWREIELCHKLLYTGPWKFRGKTEARANPSPRRLLIPGLVSVAVSGVRSLLIE